MQFVNILSGDLDEGVYQEEEPKYEESIPERTKTRRQNQEGQGLKILTPEVIILKNLRII